MPKELTHWWIAYEALRGLPPDSQLGSLLHENLAAYLTGAILPDTLMHILRGPYAAQASLLADRFHAPAGNSYSPLAAYVERQQDIGPSAKASLIGVMAHMEADIIFHPFIYAQSGKDLGRHYRIETEIDVWLTRQQSAPPVRLLKDLLNEELLKTSSCLISDLLDPAGTIPPEAVRGAIASHSKIQEMYSDPFWQLVARFLGFFPGTPASRWQWLFYPPEMKEKREFVWPSNWIHPSNGKSRGDTPEGLLTDAVARLSNLLFEIDKNGLAAAIKKQPGENLITGLAN